MDKRKILGAIIGLIFWSLCVVFFTYAYYDWKSNPTNVVLGIEDLNVDCLVGANVNATNIGPVLNYQDGVKAEFSIDNSMTDNMAIELYLDITSISDVNLLTESLKYILVADSTGDTNYDYNNPVRTGDFSNFNVGNNLIAQDLEVTASTTTNYQFIIYIDGNMYNNPNIQENSLIANLMLGNCDEDAVQYDDLVYQAIYSETDNSLTFVHTTPLTVGDTYNDKAVTAVYTGFEKSNYVAILDVPWSDNDDITTVIFESEVFPKSTAFWFSNLPNLSLVEADKLNTSNVINMSYMFNGCKKLSSLDLSNFDTSKVKDMKYMLNGAENLIELDISSFNTSNVTNMEYMFSNCSKLNSLDISGFITNNVTNMSFMFNKCSELNELSLKNFNTTNVINMLCMFNYCSNLTKLELSSFNTGKVTNMSCMFNGCKNLTNLNLNVFNTINVTNMSYLFNGCVSLKDLNISSFNTSNVTNMAYMFSNCNFITKIDVTNFSTNKVTDMSYMFSNCNVLFDLDLSKFNTSNVTKMQYMFNHCSNIQNLNLETFNTSKVENMSYMFNGCKKLANLHLSNFDISNVTKSEYMFNNCANLSTSIVIKNDSIDSYTNMFGGSATISGTCIIVYYMPDDPTTEDVNESTEAIVDLMIATKSASSNILKRCYGDNCSV